MRYRIRLDPYGDEIDKTTSRTNYQWWYGNMTLYIDQFLIIQRNITANIRQVLKEYETDDQMALIGLSALVVVVVMFCPIVLAAVYSLTISIQKYSLTLVNR
jgi:hypothetical protein